MVYKTLPKPNLYFSLKIPFIFIKRCHIATILYFFDVFKSTFMGIFFYFIYIFA